MTRIWMPLIATLALIAAAHPATAAPTLHHGESALVLANPLVTARVVNETATITLHPTVLARSDSALLAKPADAYDVQLLALVEYFDVDADGKASPHEIVGRLALHNASWNVSTVETPTEAVVNLTLTAPVRVTGSILDEVALNDRIAELTILVTMRDAALDGGADALSVPASAIETRLVVHKWPMLDARGRLQLDLLVNATLAPVPTGADVARDEDKLGELAWTPHADARTAEDVEFVAPVRASYAADGNATRLSLAYDAPGIARLDHAMAWGVTATDAPIDALDGTAPLSSAVKEAPGPGLLAGLAAGALGALALARRRVS